MNTVQAVARRGNALPPLFPSFTFAPVVPAPVPRPQGVDPVTGLDFEEPSALTLEVPVIPDISSTDYPPFERRSFWHPPSKPSPHPRRPPPADYTV